VPPRRGAFGRAPWQDAGTYRGNLEAV
jgi:hypothetical protein